ncbi:hypothetical protein LCGC14_1578150 [marine sediment metagenome]|uniref:Uncharacterized protein n=1 Tax=marine sediment metagenome TaxID=412755 RepID=A0A0F9LHY8_9ZZZZ
MTNKRIKAIRKISTNLRESYIAADSGGMIALVPVTFQDVLDTINHLNDYVTLLEKNQTSHRD